MEPTWYNLADYLIQRFPALEREIEESYLWWAEAGNPYPHVFLEEFLIPALTGQGDHSDPAVRSTAGEILDQLLVSPDSDLASAALTAVLEMLRDEPELRAASWPFLGPIAREWLARMTST